MFKLRNDFAACDAGRCAIPYGMIQKVQGHKFDWMELDCYAVRYIRTYCTHTYVPVLYIAHWSYLSRRVALQR